MSRKSAFALAALLAVLCSTDVAAAPQGPTFAVWYAPGAPDDFETLRSVLGHPKDAHVQRVDDTTMWMASGADVLVLRGSERGGPDVPRASPDFRPIGGRRLFAIGREARHAFQDLGLDLGTALVLPLFGEKKAVVRLEAGTLVPASKGGQDVEALRSDESEARLSRWEGLSLFRGHPENAEVVARWASMPSHAPIARERNCVFCGIAADASLWSAPFRDDLREIAHALARRPLEPFDPPPRVPSGPGTYDFVLSRSGVSRRSFFVRLDEPCLLEVRLDVTGGRGRLHLRPERPRDRRPAILYTGDPRRAAWLEPVLPADVAALGDRYWVVEASTLSSRSEEMRCVLRIGVEKNPVLRLPGIDVAMAKPPSDGASIHRLIAFMSSADEEERRRAEAALIVVGRPAAPYVYAAMRKDRDARSRFFRVLRRIGPGWRPPRGGRPLEPEED